MTADPTSGHQTLEFLVSDGRVRQVGPGHMGCKHPDCANAEFWITTDGRIICADDECFTEYGHLASVTPDELAKLRARLAQADALIGQLERITTAWTRGMYSAWIDCQRGDTKAATECLAEGLDGYDGLAWDGTETGAGWWERTKAEEGL
jgi:hypothetical protein